ncbi:MAG: N-acetyl-alpha-D-glucosaminyl L-malate synthase BshA [Nitrospinota bacterium]|nr:MAG: N-acetyl-alpha-D-glucosaminyl L-malate synthase BshA [Nitrospinota bacterium]
MLDWPYTALFCETAMKIGIVCYPTFGGSGVIATELGTSLSRRGHEVHIICYNQPARLYIHDTDITFHLVNVVSYPLFEFPPYTLALASKIYEVIEQHALDLVHVHYAIPHSTAAYLAQMMASHHPTRIITTLHGTDIILVGLDPSYRRVTKFSIEQSNGVTAVSHYLADLTRAEFQVQIPIRVIPNFVDLATFRPQHNPLLRAKYAKPHERIIVHISNFRPLKRVPLLIQLFARILEQVPARLLLIGNGPDYPACVDLVRRYAPHNQVFFLDFVHDVASILSIADLFLFPSEIESFGLAALEALSCGVPVVAFRVGGLPEAIVHGETGYLVEPDDVEGMIKAAVELLQDADRRQAMGERGRRWVEEHFNIVDVTRQYEEFYRHVLSQA